MPPELDDVEVNVFGPGFGESILIHIGYGKWVIVDSCLDRKTKEPAALQYLDAIGVDPASSVVLVIITHWHDDHIRGMASIIKRCPNARVCVSAAFRDPDFSMFITSYDVHNNSLVTSGVNEISRVLDAVKQTKQPVSAVLASRRVYFTPEVENQSLSCEIWALSPSDVQFQLALRRLAREMPKIMHSKIRTPDQDPNDLSIAAWLRVGEVGILLGADLEEPGKDDLGWSAVLSDVGRPRGKAFVFKIPHHGSSNGHHNDVWADMVHSEAISVLTPYNKNLGLPTPTDIDRIYAHCRLSFSSGRLKDKKLHRNRPRAVTRTLAEMGEINLREALNSAGHVQIRLVKDGSSHAITLHGDACELRDVAI